VVFRSFAASTGFSCMKETTIVLVSSMLPSVNAQLFALLTVSNLQEHQQT
jgi:hypothetical protein